MGVSLSLGTQPCCWPHSRAFWARGNVESCQTRTIPTSICKCMKPRAFAGVTQEWSMEPQLRLPGGWSLQSCLSLVLGAHPCCPRLSSALLHLWQHWGTPRTLLDRAPRAGCAAASGHSRLGGCSRLSPTQGGTVTACSSRGRTLE